MVEATVLIAAWCAQETLEASVTSALAQEDVSLEVIIADDASTDGTGVLARHLAERDSRVRYVRLEHNGGPSAARNAALAMARGVWVAVLDADDAYVPGRLRRLIDFAQAQGADVVCDNLQVVGEAGKPSVPHPFLHGPAFAAPLQLDLPAYLSMNQAELNQPSLGYLKPVLNRAFMQMHGVRYDEQLRNGEDFHLILAMLAAEAGLWVSPEVGYLYTARSGSVSSRLNVAHARALGVADRAFLTAHPDLAPPVRRLMRRRINRIANLAAAESVLQAIKRGRIPAAVSALAARPQAGGRLLSQTAAALRKRLIK